MKKPVVIPNKLLETATASGSRARRRERRSGGRRPPAGVERVIARRRASREAQHEPPQQRHEDGARLDGHRERVGQRVTRTLGSPTYQHGDGASERSGPVPKP